MLGRYGGEEFLLVGLGLGEEEAAGLLAGLGEVTPAGQSFSAGLASWDGEERPEALVHRADLALYTAKRTGRRRVVRAQALAVSV